MATGLLAGCAPTGEPAASPAPSRAERTVSALAAAQAEHVNSPTQEPPITFPVDGGGKWRAAGGRSAVAGSRGELLRYRVAVERNISGIDVDQFAATVSGTLADPRSWTASGTRRLQRVGPGDRADFTIYLATPATRDQLCADGYDRYTSCRNGNSVVLNVDRWAHAVPQYDLETYRTYMVNHETGHRLGYGHDTCPGKGKPAPVMQQQTLGLHGCVPNPWPYLDGKLYRGR